VRPDLCYVNTRSRRPITSINDDRHRLDPRSDAAPAHQIVPILTDKAVEPPPTVLRTKDGEPPATVLHN